MNNGSLGAGDIRCTCVSVCVCLGLADCQRMDTKDVEWLGVWHSIAEHRLWPLGDGHKLGARAKTTAIASRRHISAASIVGLRLTVTVIID